MKTLKLLAAAAAVLVLAASCTYQKGEKGIEAPLPTNAEVDSVSYLLGVNFAYYIKTTGISEKLNEINVSLMKKGMKDYLNAKGNLGDEGFNEQFKVNPDLMNASLSGFIGKRNAYKAEVSQKKEDKFLAENKVKDGVNVTESGLQYIIYDEGNDVKPDDKDTIWVHYTGTLLDGTVFDENTSEQEPQRMFMHRVVKGLSEGLKFIGEGGHMKLFLPAKLGYGERGNNRTVLPNSTLIFDIELTKVGKIPVVEEEETK